MANTLTNLGNAYGDLGDHAKKRDMLERALAIEERAYGPDHVELAITLWNLAEANGNLGDTVRQREILERALVINESAYGPDHSETVDCREALEALINFPLHAAAKGGNVDAITRLLDDGAEADRANEDGETPLYVACEKGHVDAARLLLERGADVHRSNSDNDSPLHLAAWYGHIEVCQLLLDNGATADLDCAGNDGGTPKMWATEAGHSAIVDLLGKYVADS